MELEIFKARGDTLKILVFRHQLFKVSEPFIAQQALACSNTDVTFIGKCTLGKSPEKAKVVAIDDMPENRSFWRRAWVAVSRDPGPYLKWAKAADPALIHAHFAVEGVYALRLAKKLAVPLVVTFHGFDASLSLTALLLSRSPSWINYAIFRRGLAARGTLFICVSKWIQARVVDLGFPIERTCVHYMGVDTDSITPRDIKEETLTILQVGRLVEKKGVEYTIRAFALILNLQEKSRLIIIGDGPERKMLEVLADSLGIANHVSFLGPQPHSAVLASMRSAAMLVFPSVTANNGDSEGLGMVLLEAAALGVPAIGTRHGGIPEAIEDGKTGYLVDERDVDGLSQRMLQLLEDKELRLSMGRGARRLVEERFNLKTQSLLLEDLYERVAG